LYAIALKNDIGHIELCKDSQTYVQQLNICLKDGTNVWREEKAVAIPISGVKAFTRSLPAVHMCDDDSNRGEHYGQFDLIKGFCPLRLDDLRQELMSYAINSKIYSPHGAPPCCCDAVVHFQQRMDHCFEPRFSKYRIIWIDDLLPFNDGIDT
ncbi:Retrovirusrelated Pol Polyprotein from transposon 297, partial [Phytophthora megakarya]